MTVTRTPYSVLVEADDVWAIQQFLKVNTVVLSPVNNRPVLPVETSGDLRKKVNAVILRFADEPGLGPVELSLTYNECWMIDWAFNIQVFKGAEQFLVGVLRVMWEYENHTAINEAAAGADPEWDREWERQYKAAMDALDGGGDAETGSRDIDIPGL